MKPYKLIPILLTVFFNLNSDHRYSDLLESPYPPPVAFCEANYQPTEAINTIDDLADFEVGRKGSLQRDGLEYHKRLISSINSTEEFYNLNEVGGYLIRYSKNESILPKVKEKIQYVFDRSMRTIYYAGYGWETLEEALYEHERLQSAVSKYYPDRIPLSTSRLSAYYKAMVHGYRRSYLEKIEQIREERLTVISISGDEDTNLIKPGINPVRLVLDKETQKPLAIWKAGSDKSYGAFILMGMGTNEKLYKLESAKIEMGYIAEWNELIAQGLNYIAKGRFLTPAVARFGKTTLHAYHENDASLSQSLHDAESVDTFVESFERSHVQHWGMMQFLMSATDAHRGNTLIDGKHLLLIDFGRVLGPYHSKLNFFLRNSALDWPQMKAKFCAEDLAFFGKDLNAQFHKYFEDFDIFEERKAVKSLIAISLSHLKTNLRVLRAAVQKDMTPFQIFRLKYPPIELEDHFRLEALFSEMHKKSIYDDEVKLKDIRLTLAKSKIFESAPFAKAVATAGDDEELFDYLIDRELEIILQTPEDELFKEIQLGWLIRASLIIPIKLKPFF